MTSYAKALVLAASVSLLAVSGASSNEQLVAAAESAHGGQPQASINTLTGTVIASANEFTRSDSPFLLAEGDEISICIDAPRQGYVTVWSRTPSDSHLEMLYPNSFTHADGSEVAPINAGGSVCLGSETDPYRIRVAPDRGESEVYVLWTKSADDQIRPSDIVTISDRTNPPDREKPVAATTMTYKVQ